MNWGGTSTKSCCCHDAYRKNTDKKQKQNRKQTKEKPCKNQKPKTKHSISRSVHDLGNLEKGDSIVSSKVFFFVPEPVAFRRVYGTWNLLVYHVTIAAPYPGGIDPRLAVYARSWDGHYTTTRRDRLYHPRCHPQDWKGGQTKQNKTGNNHRSRHTNSVRRETNTTLHGNQGSPQPGAPKSHSVSCTGNRAHRIEAIQKLAMAMPCRKWKGETE